MKRVITGLLFQCWGWMAGNGASQVIWSANGHNDTQRPENWGVDFIWKMVCSFSALNLQLRRGVGTLWQISDCDNFTFDCTTTHQQNRTDLSKIKYICAYEITGFLCLIKWGCLKSNDHFHVLPSLVYFSLLGTPPPLSQNPYLSLRSGNYLNELSLLLHSFYSTTWSVNNNLHVILCDVAAHSVTSFQVQHLWTSNLF